MYEKTAYHQIIRKKDIVLYSIILFFDVMLNNTMSIVISRSQINNQTSSLVAAVSERFFM
jgi:hypothetical protein